MPNSPSATKRLRSDAAKHERNLNALTALKTLDQKLRSLDKDPAKAKELARLVSARFDRAVTRGMIPRGRADRKKSRIAKFLARISK